MNPPSKKSATARKVKVAAPAAKTTSKATATRKKTPQSGNAKQRKTKVAGKRSNSNELLLEATSKVLSERNTMDVSLSEIAEASGLNSALISYHFGNKEGLLLALVRRDAENALSQLDQLLAMNISPEQKIRLHIRGVINTYAKFPYLNRLIHILLDSTNADASRELANFFIAPLVAAETKIIEEGVAAGIFRRVDPMYFYFTFAGACDVIFYGRQSLESVFAIRELTPKILNSYAEFVADTALRLLKPD